MRLRWLVALYPKAWRVRYAEEFIALLEATPFSFGVLLDIFCGALDARLRYKSLPRFSPVASPHQQAIRQLLQAFSGYLVAGLAFYAMLDDSPYASPRQIHAALVIPVLIVQCAAVVAAGAFFTGSAIACRIGHSHRSSNTRCRRAVLPSFVVTLAMASSSVAAFWWGMAAMQWDPQGFLYGRWGAFGSNTAISWGLTTALMLTMTTLGALSLRGILRPEETSCGS